MKHTKIWLWTAVASVLVLIVGVLLFLAHRGKTVRFEGEYPDAVVVELTDNEGKPYNVEAISGQVCIWFEEGVSHSEAKNIIRSQGGEVVAQIPSNGYYLVQVSNMDVNAFIRSLKDIQGVDLAFPNTVSYPCMADVHIMDNFYPDSKANDTTPHGVVVQYALQECGSDYILGTHNIGSSNGKYMIDSEEAFALNDILKKSKGDRPIIINMSYGPSLPRRIKNGQDVSYYWPDATVREKKLYRQWYYESVKRLVGKVKKYQDKDFIITIAAGNEGVKNFDAAILSCLRDSLDPEEQSIFYDHFILVSAEDKRGNWVCPTSKKCYKTDVVRSYSLYSNELEKELYNPWVIKVDISDFKYQGIDKAGTSFAAPRVACLLSSATNKYGIKATEVLNYAREATLNAPDYILTEELLDEVINNNKNKDVVIEGVLKMYLLDAMGGSDGLDGEERPFCKEISEYQDIEELQYIAYVVEPDHNVDVKKYITEDEYEFLKNYYESERRQGASSSDGEMPSGFMVVPNVGCKGYGVTGAQFADKYANNRVRVKGSLYVPVGGWRNVTPVVMSMRSIELVGKKSTSKRTKPKTAPRAGTLSPEQAARRLGVALCDGDVSTIKTFTTADFFDEVMETLGRSMALLGDDQRQKAKQGFSESLSETIKTGDKRVIVRFKRDRFQMDFYMLYDKGWKCYDYASGGVHIPKSVRKSMRDNRGY